MQNATWLREIEIAMDACCGDIESQMEGYVYALAKIKLVKSSEEREIGRHQAPMLYVTTG